MMKVEYKPTFEKGFYADLRAECLEIGAEPEKGLYSPAKFRVFYGSSEIGVFTLAPLPGCCGVVVSTGTWLEPKWRGQHHVSRSFHNLKAETARQLGYTLMLATVELTNIPELVGAAKAGWKVIQTFRNQRTSHDLGVMVRQVK